MAVDQAVKRASKITLEWNKNRCLQNHHKINVVFLLLGFFLVREKLWSDMLSDLLTYLTYFLQILLNSKMIGSITFVINCNSRGQIVFERQCLSFKILLYSAYSRIFSYCPISAHWTYVTTWLWPTACADHTGLDRAPPPAWARAGPVVDTVKKDLPHSAGHTSIGWGKREVGQKWRATAESSMNFTNRSAGEAHWRCVHIRSGSRCCCGVRSHQMKADRPFSRKRWLKQERTASARQCHY